MDCQISGLGNALVDALVVLEDDSLLDDLGLVRGTMHLVDHEAWQKVYERVRDHKVTFDSGGSCANTIATIGYLGGVARYCGQVGDDQMGRMYEDRLIQACGGHNLQFTDEHPTGKCLSIISGADAERTMLTDLGAAVNLPSLGGFNDTIAKAKIAHFTGYTLLEGPMRDMTVQAMAFAQKNGVRVSLDAADPFVVMQTRELLWQLLTDHVDIIFLNREEAKQLTDKDGAEAVAAIVERAKVDTVIVKLGSEGSLVWANGELFRIPVRMVKALDTTGAGDAYAGGFLFGQLEGWDPRSCGMLATAVAGQTVSQVGAVVKDRELLEGLKTAARSVAPVSS